MLSRPGRSNPNLSWNQASLVRIARTLMRRRNKAGSCATWLSFLKSLLMIKPMTSLLRSSTIHSVIKRRPWSTIHARALSESPRLEVRGRHNLWSRCIQRAPRWSKTSRSSGKRTSPSLILKFLKIMPSRSSDHPTKHFGRRNRPECLKWIELKQGPLSSKN